MEIFIATAIIAVCLAVVLPALWLFLGWLKSGLIEMDEPTTISYAPPAKPSNYMAVPKSRPVLRTRNSKSW